jgi:hypothetical protein
LDFFVPELSAFIRVYRRFRFFLHFFVLVVPSWFKTTWYFLGDLGGSAFLDAGQDGRAI